MKEFIGYLLGNIGVSLFLALYFFALIGVCINLLVSAASRDQLNPATPESFSFAFLVCDNYKRILLNALLIYVCIRFAAVIFSLNTEDKELYLFAALVIGFSFDKLAEYLKERGQFLKVRKPDEIKPIG